MTASRQAGSLNQHDHPVDTQDQTSTVGASPLTRSLGADNPALVKMAASPENAAYQALAFVKDIIEKQNQGIELYGFGPYYGDESRFSVASHYPHRVEWSRKHKLAMLKRMLKPGLTLEEADYPQPINCIELLFLAMKVYQDARQKPWGPIINRARDARSARVRSGRGTVLIEQARREAGFTTWYYSRDVSKALEEFNFVRAHHRGPPHDFKVRGADSHHWINVGVRINRFTTNFAPGLHPHHGTIGLAELNKVPFALGAADWGYHTFVFSCGSVFEAHWGSGPNQKKVFEENSFAEKFSKLWPTGVIAAAPGQW